jgi:hypothetical protein
MKTKLHLFTLIHAEPVSVLTFDTEMDQITGERAKTKLSVAWRRFWYAKRLVERVKLTG